MHNANHLIDAAINRGVQTGTTLQEAVRKLRRARRSNDNEFEIALGELWVVASDYFVQRNKAIAKSQDLEFENRKLKEEIARHHLRPYVENSNG